MTIDYSSHLDKLRKDAAEAALIRDLATNHAKRELFERLAQHLSRLADEVERARDAPVTAPPQKQPPPQNPARTNRYFRIKAARLEE